MVSQDFAVSQVATRIWAYKENVTETDEDGMKTVEERRVPVIVHPFPTLPPPLPPLPLRQPSFARSA